MPPKRQLREYVPIESGFYEICPPGELDWDTGIIELIVITEAAWVALKEAYRIRGSLLGIGPRPTRFLASHRGGPFYRFDPEGVRFSDRIPASELYG